MSEGVPGKRPVIIIDGREYWGDPGTSHAEAYEKFKRRRAEAKAKQEKDVPQNLYREDGSVYKPGESAIEDLLIGANRGMENVGKQAINLATSIPGLGGLRPDFASDEALANEASVTDQITDQSGWAQGGELAGEMLALAPLGAGRVAAGAAAKGTPTLAKALNAARGGSRTARAMLEGAGAGTLLAGPGSRGSGATGGALTSGVLSKASQGLGRTFHRGLGKTSKAAKEFMDETGASLPVALRADKAADPLTSKVASTYSGVVGLFPNARDRFAQQGDKAMNDWYKTLLKKAYTKKEVYEAAVKKLDDTSSLKEALEVAEEMINPRNNSTKFLRQALRSAGQGPKRGRFTPEGLRKTIEQLDAGRLEPKGSKAMGLKSSEVAGDVFENKLIDSTPSGRNIFYDIMSATANLADIGGVASSMLSSPGMQNFIMGNTAAQKALQKAIASGSGQAVMEVLNAIRNQVSGNVAQSGSEVQ